MMKIIKEYFGTTKELKPVDIFTISNNNGMVVRILNYGGIIQSLTAPDRNGNYLDVVLGYDKLEDYQTSSPYFGCIVGRYCNRIANGKFVLAGTEYNLFQNEGSNHLHGGLVGFDKVIWDAATYQNENAAILELKYLSIDGEEGYPGNLSVEVKYILTNNDELVIEYEASTDKTTHVNLTNHSYFNLSADFNKNILEHELWINADTFLPINDESVPIGIIETVIGTPMDFTKSTKLGLRINDDNEQLLNGSGYDHCMIFKESNRDLRLQANLYEEKSGRFFELFTSEPAVQLYTGNHLDGSYIGKKGIVYNKRAGICLETEHYPDTPNRQNFESTIIRPGKKYSSKTVYKFSVK